VIGAGPAGLQAARIAAERGHAVTLFGASAEPGGKLAWEASLPGRGEYAGVMAWMTERAKRAGVNFELGTAAAPSDVQAVKPDSVIVAAGAHPRRPDNFVGGGASVRDWPPGVTPADGTAVLFDMDQTAATYAVADALAATYRRLVLLTPRTQLARGVNYCSAIGVQRRLSEANVEIIVAGEPLSLRNGQLTWRNVFTGRTREIADVALFLWSTPRLADDAIAAPLRAAGLEVRLAGDCLAPRDLFCAIHEGEAAGMQV
jgi:thioredoxin reductase